MSKNDGGQAFPRAAHGGYFAVDGMSLRDYFAANASDADVAEMQSSFRMRADGGYDVRTDAPPSRSQARYMHADAMLAAREVAQ